MFTIFECLRPGLHDAIFVREKEEGWGYAVLPFNGAFLESLGISGRHFGSLFSLILANSHPLKRIFFPYMIRSFKIEVEVRRFLLR